MAQTDHILCFICLKAVGNWRKVAEKFNEHERSELHSESVQKLAAFDDVPMDARLSSVHARKKATARHCLQLLFRTIQFLGSKGIAFRGNTAHKGILYELMLERTYDLPEERKEETTGCRTLYKIKSLKRLLVLSRGKLLPAHRAADCMASQLTVQLTLAPLSSSRAVWNMLTAALSLTLCFGDFSTGQHWRNSSQLHQGCFFKTKHPHWTHRRILFWWSG